MNKKVIIIAAMSINGGIGKNNDLLFKIPEDMKHFKETTKNSVVIMGRKTYESIGNPLPYRRNVVITRNEEYDAPDDVMVANKLDKNLINAIKAEVDSNIYIIGGGEIYKQALDNGLVDKMIITVYNKEYPDVDVFFPDNDFNVKKVIHNDEYDGYEYAICEFTK